MTNENICPHTDIFSKFVAGIFVIAHCWEQPKFQSIGKWINKVWYIHIAVKRKGIEWRGKKRGTAGSQEGPLYRLEGRDGWVWIHNLYNWGPNAHGPVDALCLEQSDIELFLGWGWGGSEESGKGSAVGIWSLHTLWFIWRKKGMKGERKEGRGREGEKRQKNVRFRIYDVSGNMPSFTNTSFSYL